MKNFFAESTFIRYSLGIVFIWFGTLKFFNVSPVLGLINSVAPISFPLQIPLLGLFEILVGVGFLHKKISRLSALCTVFYLFVITSLVLIKRGFSPWFPLLTYDGEFVIKNIVFIAVAVLLFLEEDKE